jgi:hypothetical protein
MLHLTLDLTRHRLDLFAEIGAAAPPTPGTDARWRAVAAVREAVYALRQRGLVQYVGEVEVVNWAGLMINSIYAPKPGARHCEEWR